MWGDATAAPEAAAAASKADVAAGEAKAGGEASAIGKGALAPSSPGGKGGDSWGKGGDKSGGKVKNACFLNLDSNSRSKLLVAAAIAVGALAA